MALGVEEMQIPDSIMKELGVQETIDALLFAALKRVSNAKVAHIHSSSCRECSAAFPSLYHFSPLIHLSKQIQISSGYWLRESLNTPLIHAMVSWIIPMHLSGVVRYYKVSKVFWL
jgi:hypothetical protein